MANQALANETLCALRQKVRRIETGAKHNETLEKDDANRHIRLGVNALNDALEGGVPLEGLSEIRTGKTPDAGAAAGFCLGLATLARKQNEGLENRHILWISEAMAMREAGHANANGLTHFGLNATTIIHASPKRHEHALWICETALASTAFAAIILEIRGNPFNFGLAESRRLHLRARKAKIPLFLLRQAGEEEASSALVRFCVHSAPARTRKRPDGCMMPGTIGNPVFNITLEKSRLPAPFQLFMEWNPDECQFYPVKSESALSSGPQQDATRSRAHISLPANRSSGAQTMGAVVAFDRAS